MNLRRWLGVMVAVACATVASATPGSAGQHAPPSGGATGTPGSYVNLQPRRQMPQRPLFEMPVRPDPDRPESQARRSDTRVVCGMTLLPGDVAVDPGIRARVSPGAARPTMRAVEPSICWERGTPR